MRMAVDTFCEKINLFYATRLPRYTRGMHDKLHRQTVHAQAYFDSEGEEANEFDDDRLRRRAIMFKWAVIFLYRHKVFSPSTQPALSVEVKGSLPLSHNADWNRVLRSDESQNCEFPLVHLRTYANLLFNEFSPTA